MESPTKPSRLLLRDAINNNWENNHRVKSVSPLGGTSPLSRSVTSSTADQCSGWCRHYPHSSSPYTRSDSGFHSEFGGTAGSRSPTPPGCRTAPQTPTSPAPSANSASKTSGEMTRPLRILIVGGQQVGKSGLTVRYLSNQDKQGGGIRRQAAAAATINGSQECKGRIAKL